MRLAHVFARLMCSRFGSTNSFMGAAEAMHSSAERAPRVIRITVQARGITPLIRMRISACDGLRAQPQCIGVQDANRPPIHGENALTCPRRELSIHALT